MIGPGDKVNIVTGGSVTNLERGPAVFVSGGTLNVTDGSISSNGTGVLVMSGAVKISGGSILGGKGDSVYVYSGTASIYGCGLTLSDGQLVGTLRDSTLINMPTSGLTATDQSEATAAALQEGWLRTGDLTRQDGEGYITHSVGTRFVGQKKEIIIRGGSNISPQEVEAVVCQNPAVRPAGVIGVPDPTWGRS